MGIFYLWRLKIPLSSGNGVVNFLRVLQEAIFEGIISPIKKRRRPLMDLAETTRISRRGQKLKMEGIKHGRLARECAELDPHLEKKIADEGLSIDLAEWPAYAIV
jgi:hypothetical protein